MHKLAAAFIAGILLVGIPPLAFIVAADDIEILKEECRNQLNLGDSGCACIGDRAEDVLNENQQGLVVAMVTKDQAASAALRDQMTVEEITGAANFMMEAPQFCAAQ